MTTRKRGNGDGTVYEKNGRFCGQFSYRAGGRLVRTTKYFRTKTDAKQWLSQQSEANGRRALPSGARMTFGAFAAAWVEERKLDVRRGRPVGTVAVASKSRTTSRTISPTTWKSYNGMTKWFTAILGQRRIDAITTEEIDATNRQLLTQHAAASVKIARVLLSMIFKAARRRRLIVVNPVEDSEPISVEEFEARVLDESEALRFVEACEGERLEAFFRLGVAIGQRQGEGLALRWAHLDGNTISIEEQIQPMPRQLRTDPKQARVVLPPKWGSKRKVVLPPVLVEVLEAHRRRQAAERAAAGSRWQANDLIFCTKWGRPLNPSGLIRRDFRRVCSKAGIQFSDRQQYGLRFHDLRGSTVSILLAQGIDIPTIMDIVGHKSVAMFLHYKKVLKSQRAASAVALEKIYGPQAHA